MFKASTPLVVFTCILLTLITAVATILFAQMLLLNCVLVLVIFITILVKEKIYTSVFCGVSVVIMLFSLLKKGDTTWQLALFQQLISCVIAVVACWLVMHAKKMYGVLETEKVQMNALFEYANEGIIVTDSAGRIVMINPSARKLFMYESSALLGNKIDILMPQRFHLAYEKQREAYFLNPTGNHLLYKWNLLALKKNGDQLQVEVSLSFFQQDEAFYAVAFVNDATERKQSGKLLFSQRTQSRRTSQYMLDMNAELESKVAERTLILQEALQELERSQLDLNEALSKEKELNEIKSRFVSMASHEFRTPLSTVLSSASLISKYRTSEDQPKREKHINRIKDSVMHLNYLLEDFLSLGKLAEGRVSTHVSEFNVPDFLNDVLDEMKSGLKPGQELLLDYEGELLFITDKRLLKNVLINLLSNAIKFSEAGKPVSVRAVHSPPLMIIQVKDQGMGIAPEDLPHLFSTFYRGKNVVNIQGTGLGLHIVKRYIHMLNGRITLSTWLHEGTTVNIGLPSLLKLSTFP